MRENDAREGGDDLCLAKKLVSTELNPGISETPKLTLDRLRDVLNPPTLPGHGLAHLSLWELSYSPGCLQILPVLWVTATRKKSDVEKD